MRKILAIIFLGFIGVSGSVYGACYNDCEPLPDCAQMGYKLAEEIFCPDGAITCPFDSRYKWCKEYTCKDGRYSDTATLTGEKGYRCDKVDYHHLTCYDCRCDPDPDECKWSNLNKGNGELGDRCCDGHFATCKNQCKNTVEVPLHAHGIKETCTGCEKSVEIITSWECDEWYDKMKDGCYARQCAEGYSITESSIKECGKKGLGEKGWTWESKGYMGEDICGKCTAKSCLDGFSAEYPSVEKCGEHGSAGWNWKQSDQYAGDAICGMCTEKQCPNNETTESDVKNCGTTGAEGWTKKASGSYAGDSPCYKCEPNTCSQEVTPPTNADCSNWCTTGNNRICVNWVCKQGYTSDGSNCNITQCPNNSATSTSNCGNGQHPDGWELGAANDTWSGNARCQACAPKVCAEGNTSANDINKCNYLGTIGASKTLTGGYSGDDPCYKCVCNAPAECKWTEGAQGNGSLSMRCCNNKYQNCTSNCVESNPPVHGECKEHCTGCGKEVCIKWDCVDGYKKDGSNCIPAQCPTGFSTDIQTSDNCSPAGSGWSVTFNGKSGETPCGQCKCSSSCKWNNTNKGNATLNDPCCNGNYAFCTSTCQEVEIPENASCTSDGMCSGCNEDPVCTKWECKEGYHPNDAGTGCEEDCVKFATSPCAVGSIYFSDGTCASPEVCLPSDRIPVGVVYWLKDNSGQLGKIINLHDLGRSSSSATFNPEDPYNTTYAKFNWGNYGTDIADLENWDCLSNDYRTVAQTEDRTNPFWSAGMDNTQIIAEVQDNNLQYPASVALAFYPPKVSANDPKLGKGHWYLPTLGEWMDLYGYDYSNLGTTCNMSSSGADGNTKTTVNATLTTLKNKGVTAEALDDDDVYWSSSEYSSYYAWGFDMRYGSRYGNWKKSYSDLVRVSLEFGCLKFETSPCAVGSIYFSDGTCASPEVCLPSDRVPVGVVYWVEDSGEYYKVINLKDLGKAADNQPFDSANSYDSNFPYLYWGYYGYDIVTLFNFEKYTKEKKLELLQNRASDLYDGKGNTDKILADKGPDCSKEQGTANYYKYCVPEAAQAAHDFYPYSELQKDPKVGQGHWYLPSIGELMDVYGYDNAGITNYSGTSGANGENKKVINTTLRTLKFKGVEATELSTDKEYISSLEGSIYSANTLAMKDGYRSSSYKYSNYHVRAGLEVGCPKKTFSEFPEHSVPGTTCTTLNGEMKYKSFDCKDGYAKNKEETECIRFCEIGDVFYADNTCGKVENYVNGSSPKPIGVVYWVTENGEHGKAINFHDLGRSSSSAAFDPANPYVTGYKTFSWGLSGDIEGLTNWDCDSFLDVVKGNDHNNEFWSGGLKYTQLIAEFAGNDLKYAAPAAKAFYPSENLKNDPNFGVGHWYLPTFGELMDLYGYSYGDWRRYDDGESGSVCTNRQGASSSPSRKVIDATLTALNAKGVTTAEKLTQPNYYTNYCSSSEFDQGKSWKLTMYNGLRSYDFKSNSCYVRVSLEF